MDAASESRISIENIWRLKLPARVSNRLRFMMVHISATLCPTGGIVYKDFRKLIHINPKVADCVWETFNYEKKCKFVWKAAKKVHFDVLKWTLQPVDCEKNDRKYRRTRIDARTLRTENEGWTLLHYVCANIDENVQKLYSMFRFLVLWAGCQVNARDNRGETPFHHVCGSHVKRDWKGRRVYVRLLKLLIKHGADVDETVQGITPLHLVHESPWAIKFLILDAKANPDPEDTFQRTPFFWSIRNVHFPPANRIPVSVFRDRIDFRRKDYMGHSIVHYAMLRAHSDSVYDVIDLMRRLVDVGADVNASNRRLRTPLFLLIHRPDLIPLAEAMITSFGADVNLCDADGYTVVHIAALMGRLDYVALFVPYMPCNIATRNGQTVRSCVETYNLPCSITPELAQMLRDLDVKKTVVAPRQYQDPFTVWEYVTLLDHHRDLLSLYLVETFYRYRGGRTLFTDLFPHISHSVAIKERARNFANELANWNGKSDTLASLINNYSVGTIHFDSSYSCEDEPCRIARKVFEMVKHLMETIRRNNRKYWLLEAVPMGSACDGSKILLPDEFDFLVIFQRLKAGDEMMSSDENGGDVELFRMALSRAIQEMDAKMLDQDFDSQLGFQFVDCELRRVGLNMRLTWLGDNQRNSKYRGLNISVDLTPVYQWTGWESPSGLRPLRPYRELPEWFKLGRTIEHFRPIHNPLIIPPCATTMESECLCQPENINLQLSLRLLKLIVQVHYILQDLTAPNSHFLKTALFSYAEENGLPRDMQEVPLYVSSICHKFQSEAWAKGIPNFVADARINAPFTSFKSELHTILDQCLVESSEPLTKTFN